ncbi:MAG: nucleotidyltransferase family protein [Bacteroidia bacterium]|nr:nucleotidyltransferase family protein [Bacteroidia bacterium]
MKGMILAAGFGTRLGALTSDIPKPLLPVAGKPMIASAVEALKRAGCTDIIVNAHHHAGMIVAHFRETDYGVRIRVSVESDILGTGGGIVHARPLLGDAPFFLLHNADIVTGAILSALVEEHRRHAPLATLLVHRRETKRAVLFDESMRFLGKEVWREEGMEFPDDAQRFNYCGVQVISREFFDLAFPDGFSDLFDCHRIALSSGRMIRGMEHNAYWTDLGTEERIREHEQHEHIR